MKCPYVIKIKWVILKIKKLKIREIKWFSEGHGDRVEFWSLYLELYNPRIFFQLYHTIFQQL